jgi:Uma2 family endonuclease
MIQALPKPITFDEFIAWYPEGSGDRYELHNGLIVEMPKPTGQHSDVGGFMVAELNFEIRRARLPYRIPKECVIKPADNGEHLTFVALTLNPSPNLGEGLQSDSPSPNLGRRGWGMRAICQTEMYPDNESGYEPDIVVLDSQSVRNEPRWAKESIITMGSSVRLVVEITSTNWQDDYALKLEDYEAMGIAEYWIADYLGLGGKRFIGDPKQPTFLVCQLANGRYQIRQFRGNDRIESLVFPDLNLTAEQIFEAANP